MQNWLRLSASVASPTAPHWLDVTQPEAVQRTSHGEEGGPERSWVRRYWGLIAVLLLFWGETLALNVANPIWEAIDEPSHFQYVKFIAEHRRLPAVGEQLLQLAAGEAQCGYVIHCIARNDVTVEPPLYYLALAPFVVPIDLNSHLSWVANPYFTWPDHPLRNGVAVHTLAERWPYHGMVLGVHVMRAVSGLIVAGAVASVYFAAQALRIGPGFPLAAAATAAAAPGVILTSSSVSNDSMAILTGSLALLAAVKTLTARGRLWLVVFGIALTAAVSAKYSGLFLLPTAALLATMLAARSSNMRVKWGVMVTVAAAAAVFAISFREKRYAVISSLADIPSTVMNALTARSWPCERCDLPGQRLWGAVPNLWETFWGSYGWETFHIPAPFYRFFLAVSLLSLAGLLLACLKLGAGRLWRACHSDRGMAVVLLGVAFATLFLVVNYRYLATRSDGGSTHGRFLFPALLPMAIFLALGIYRLPKLFRAATFGLMFGTSLAVVGYSVVALPRSFGPEVPVYGDVQTAGAEQDVQFNFANGMELLGWSVAGAGSSSSSDQNLHLRLFWGATRTPDFDYSAFLRLEDGRGTVLTGADHGPGDNMNMLPHVWQPGEVIPDDWAIDVPRGTPAGDYQIKVGLYDYRDMKGVPANDGRMTVTIGSRALT